MHPEIALSPTVTSLASLSPVSGEVSRDEMPSIITPSRGTLSPGETTITSPLATVEGLTLKTPETVSTKAASASISMCSPTDLRLFKAAKASISLLAEHRSIIITPEAYLPRQRAPAEAIVIRRHSSVNSLLISPDPALIITSYPDARYTAKKVINRTAPSVGRK